MEYIGGKLAVLARVPARGHAPAGAAARRHADRPVGQLRVHPGRIAFVVPADRAGVAHPRASWRRSRCWRCRRCRRARATSRCSTPASIFFSEAIYGVLHAGDRIDARGLGVDHRQLRRRDRRDLPAAAALRDAGHRLARSCCSAWSSCRCRCSNGACAASRWCRERRPILVAEHVSKWYGQVIGLNDVSVSVPPGITGLLGPNGAGKSTFMKLITGQLRPEQGRGPGARRADLGQPEALLPARLLSRAGCVLRADDRPRVGDGARAAQRLQREGIARTAAERALGGRRPDRRRRQDDRRLQQGHAAAREARAGASSTIRSC